jgi:hypothetical protein
VSVWPPAWPTHSSTVAAFVNRNDRKVGFGNGAGSRDGGREPARRVRATRTGGWDSNWTIVANALGTQALDEPHLFETFGSEMKRSESNCQLTTAEGVGTRRSDWLGGRDSNPDNHVQSVVSYR